MEYDIAKKPKLLEKEDTISILIYLSFSEPDIGLLLWENDLVC